MDDMLLTGYEHAISMQFIQKKGNKFKLESWKTIEIEGTLQKLLNPSTQFSAEAARPPPKTGWKGFSDAVRHSQTIDPFS